MPLIKICRSCGKKIVFMFTESGAFMPVDNHSLSHNDIQLIRLGKRISFRFNDHISHFASCPNAKEFRKKKK